MSKFDSTPPNECLSAVDETLCEDPDCIRCLRQSLRATQIVVFFRENEHWRIGSFQGDRPSPDAEVDFFSMLRGGVPETVEAQGDAFILSDDKSIENMFGSVNDLLCGNSVIAAPVRLGNLTGVRLAWRDDSDPFSEEDLALIKCLGKCPEGR